MPMESVTSFDIQVNDLRYIVKPYYENEMVVKPYYENEMVFYEVFTTCEKLFTIRKNKGKWETIENDVIPINNNLVEDIGGALEEAEAQL